MAEATRDETPDVETASDAYATRFSGRAGRYFLLQQDAAVEFVLKDWSGRSVLDVGGGHAQLIPKLAADGRAVTVLGSRAQALRRVRRAYPDVSCAAGPLLQLPFADQSVDLVASVRLISHVTAWRNLVSELCRVSRSTVVIDYPPRSGFNLLTPFLFGAKKRIEGNTRRYRTFSKRELVEAFDANDFGVTWTREQLFFPMVLHRRLDSPGVLRAAERGARAMRLTKHFGSPVILRADRRVG